MILISYEPWQRKFLGDPNIIGKPMRMSRVQTPPTVIGVMPAGVRFLPTPMASKERNYTMTLALLIGSGLLIRTMMNLARVESGFETRHVLTMSVTAVQGPWKDFHHHTLERISALPGVEQATFA